MQEILLTVRYFERGLSKSLKKVTLSFLLNPVPFNGQNCKKQRAWNWWPVLLQVAKQVQKNSFISWVLSDEVWWCNIKRFLSCSKITFANLCKSIHDIIKYSTSIYPFESGKCGKKGKKLQKFEHLKIEKSFLDKIKSSFHSFWRAIIWWKNEK